MRDDEDMTGDEVDAEEQPAEEPTAERSPAGDDAAGTPEETPAGSGRGWKIAAVVAVVAAAVALGVLGSLLLFDGGGAESADKDVRACIQIRDFTDNAKRKCPPKDAKVTDGLVQKTTDGGFTMRAIRKGKLADTVKLHVREPDRPYIDIAHAQTHAALGQPIRVYTKKIDGLDSVVYMEDAPLLT